MAIGIEMPVMRDKWASLMAENLSLQDVGRKLGADHPGALATFSQSVSAMARFSRQRQIHGENNGERVDDVDVMATRNVNQQMSDLGQVLESIEWADGDSGFQF